MYKNIFSAKNYKTHLTSSFVSATGDNNGEVPDIKLLFRIATLSLSRFFESKYKNKIYKKTI